MSNKTKFDLDVLNDPNNEKRGIAMIIGQAPEHRPYVKIEIFKGEEEITGGICFQDKDLELFAVNILRAINSKRLKMEEREKKERKKK